jgi:hypothetical protein
VQHRQRRLGVLGRAEVAEDARAARGPEARLQRLGDPRPFELLAAALAEDPADQRRGRDQIARRPRVGALRAPDRGVLAGHLRRIELGLVDVGVDAGDVVLDVALDQRAGRPEDVVELVGLALEVGVGVRRHLPLLAVHRGVRAAREARQLAAAGVAQHVHEEQAVLGPGVAEPEHRAVARAPVDVGDAEALVAHDHHVVARHVAALDVRGAHAERRVLVEARDVGGRQPGHVVDEVAVHAELLAAVRDGLPGGDERRQLGQGVQAARPGGEDVAEAAAVVGAVGLLERRRTRGRQRRRRRGRKRRQRRELRGGGRRAGERGENGQQGDRAKHGAGS